MQAYKGVTVTNQARLGNGLFDFEVGVTYKEDKCKTARNGFHCCENPFECLTYYTLGKDRFYFVEAAGEIDEDESERISCTEITLIQELSIAKFALHGMSYIVEHPKREKWQQKHTGVTVEADKAEAELIAIARGTAPMAKASRNGIIGLLMENNGEIVAAAIRRIDGKKFKEDTYYQLTAGGLKEAADEEENS